jgi:hypothetical protein
LSQTACTCCAVTPAAARREATTFQNGDVGSATIGASCPPCAPSTATTAGLRAGSALPIGSQVENSCVVFDMPIDSSTMRPVGDGAPAASRGVTAAAAARPAARCAAGGTLAPAGHRPSSWPR